MEDTLVPPPRGPHPSRASRDSSGASSAFRDSGTASNEDLIPALIKAGGLKDEDLNDEVFGDGEIRDGPLREDSLRDGPVPIPVFTSQQYVIRKEQEGEART